MQMTEKLYYADSHIREFEAKVVSCEEYKDHFAVVLDKTAFFPEGGGQPGDTGKIGNFSVFDTHEKNGQVLHFSNERIEPGIKLHCEIDWDRRFSFMQNHSGEHIVSGITHKLFGYNNVGFHMSTGNVTIDFDGELSEAQLLEIENLANRAVWENVGVNTYFPSKEELQNYNYRSKLDLTDNVRLVEIEGYDLCACCAPHVNNTGEIGIIKFIDSMRHRGGMRITMVCGANALSDVREKYKNVSKISVLLSARQNETAAAVERMQTELESITSARNDLNRELLKYKISEIKPARNIILFENGIDSNSARELVNAGVKLAENISACFFGDDNSGYNYIAASRSADMRAEAKLMNSALHGRGGGKDSMIQGNCIAKRAEIEAYYKEK